MHTKLKIFQNQISPLEQIKIKVTLEERPISKKNEAKIRAKNPEKIKTPSRNRNFQLYFEVPLGKTKIIVIFKITLEEGFVFTNKSSVLEGDFEKFSTSYAKRYSSRGFLNFLEFGLSSSEEYSDLNLLEGDFRLNSAREKMHSIREYLSKKYP